MSLDRVQVYLDDNGYPRHIVEGGRDGLIRRWREFVAEVEKGYARGLEDYRNDLDLRMIIKMAGAEDAEIRQLDERLQKMLKPIKKRLWESGPGKPFWDFGFPSNASGQLLRDLKLEGIDLSK
jgi:hypothetical protein